MKKLDLVGQRFGKLVVVEFAGIKYYNGKPARTQWLCQCDCGGTITTIGSSLKRGVVNSCGCAKKEAAIKRAEKKVKSDLNSERLYNIWKGMKQRCYYENGKTYDYYGGRGIKVCDEWKNNYFAFKEWAYSNGYDENAPEKKCTIDRIDVNGDYCPENCRWVDWITQSYNRRSNRMVEYNGELKSLFEWSNITGINATVLYSRIFILKWDIHRAFTQPLTYATEPIPECKGSIYQTINYNGKIYTIKELADTVNMYPKTLLYRIIRSHWSVEKAITTPVQIHNRNKKGENE